MPNADSEFTRRLHRRHLRPDVPRVSAWRRWRGVSLLALWFTAAAALGTLSCARDGDPDSGSESHFVRCEVDEDCPLGTCEKRYCEHDGERVTSRSVSRTSAHDDEDDAGVTDGGAGTSSADASPSADDDRAPSLGASDTVGASSPTVSGVDVDRDAGSQASVTDPSSSSDQQIADGPTEMVLAPMTPVPGVPANPEGSPIDDGDEDAGVPPTSKPDTPSGEFAPETCTTPLPTLSVAETSNETVSIPGAAGVYFFSDGVSTLCVSEAVDGRVCIYGVGADATDEYSNWGAGMGVLLASMSPVDQLGVEEPFDAVAAGISGVRFSVRVLDGWGGVRPHFGIVDPKTDALLPLNFIADLGTLAFDTTVTIEFDALEHAPWAAEDLQGTLFDPTQIHSLEFVMVTVPGSVTPYSLCIEDVVWLDAASTPVVPPQPSTMLEVQAEAAALGADAGAPQ